MLPPRNLRNLYNSATHRYFILKGIIDFLETGTGFGIQLSTLMIYLLYFIVCGNKDFRVTNTRPLHTQALLS